MNYLPNEFDDRYRIRRNPQSAPSITDEYEQLADEQVDLLRLIPERPRALSYFEDILLSTKRLYEIETSGRPVIGVYCNFVPDELIYAAGAVPVRLCSGLPSAVALAEEYLPRDVCSVVRSCFGHVAGGIGFSAKCNVLIAPASCDGKRKLSSMLRDFIDVWIMDIPFRRDYIHDMDVWINETKIIRTRLENLFGEKIKYDNLRESIILSHRRAEVFRELVNFRMNFPNVLSGRDMMLVTNASFVDDIENWTDAVCRLLEELKEQTDLGEKPPSDFLPVVLTGSPILWPNWKILNIIEEAGATVIADTLCSGTQRLFNPVQVDEWTEEGMMRALALRSFSATLCPCFSDSADSIDRVLELVRDYSAKGVISHNLRLCQLIDMESSRMRPVLRERNIPFLSIHTDLSQEDKEQVKTRVEAFLEMIG